MDIKAISRQRRPNEMTQDYEEKLRKEIELANRSRCPFQEPQSTPRDIGYANLFGTSQVRGNAVSLPQPLV